MTSSRSAGLAIRIQYSLLKMSTLLAHCIVILPADFGPAKPPAGDKLPPTANVERYYDLTEELDLGVIAEHFDVHRVQGLGWRGLETGRAGYRTRRLAKLMPKQELHIMIGGTRLGGGIHPAVSIRGASAGELVRVLHHLEHVAIQANRVVA